jgi:hypothetical protein
MLIGLREVGNSVKGNCEIGMLLGKSVATGNAVGDEIGISGAGCTVTVDCNDGIGDD